MGEKLCKITIDGVEREYPYGTKLETVAREYQKEFADDILLAYVDGKLTELTKYVRNNTTVRFESSSGSAGHKTYKRSMCLMMVKAVHDVTDHTDINVRIHYSISKGYYCTVLGGDIEVNQEFLDKVEGRMHELVRADVPIDKRSINTDDAIALFHKHRMYDKEELFKYRMVSRVNIYSMNEFEDYYYGYMVPSAGYLQYFKLFPYDEGFVLQMPTAKDTRRVPPFAPQHKLFQVQKESTKWGDMQNIETVGALNRQICHNNVSELVLVQEALQEKKIAEIATAISAQKSVKFVLIAGPSSSGKTTFSHRLSIQLKANGLVPHPIAVDNYFVEREETPREADGSYNFECLEAVDVKLFNDHMQRLLAGEEVVVPTFDFIEGKKKYGGPALKLAENDVLVIEGIHCLNPKLTESLNNDQKFKIYISALTQLNIDEHNRIPTTDGRLLRRIVRDARMRGADAKKTINMWDSVRRGEEENIFPYQEEADVMFDSALIYELAVLKPYVEAQLFAIEKNAPEYVEAKRLLKFLDYFLVISSENVPANSLLREFIGGNILGTS
ncbi:uridine kinase [Lachnospiraceae bacterium PF1-22]|uniref:uridine kinase family protein n=1 Tax=Ohessyouella blattaphilus TaxID=2949333 RepID=UPI003E2D516D